MMAYSEARKRATAKYKAANYKRIPLDVPIDFYNKIKEAAGKSDEKINEYIRKAVNERMDRAEGSSETTSADSSDT